MNVINDANSSAVRRRHRSGAAKKKQRQRFVGPGKKYTVSYAVLPKCIIYLLYIHDVHKTILRISVIRP